MLVLLPVITFSLIIIADFIHLETPSLRRAFLHAAGLWSAFSVIAVELLGRFALISPESLTIVWCIFLVAVLLSISVHIQRKGMPQFSLGVPEGRWPRVLLVGIIVILITTAIVAWISPPHAIDTLHYQMSRVAHWAQNHSIGHYTTGVEAQNSRSPAAQMMLLHLYLLGGGDRLANFIQWGAMLGSVLGASLLCKQLGGKRLSQIAAGVFTATLPTGMAQASSSLTDYVVAFWVIALAVESFDLIRSLPLRNQSVHIGIAAALAFLTKPTSLPYLLPFAVVIGIRLLADRDWRLILQWVVIVAVVFAVLTGGYIYRNIETYGSFVNPGEEKTHRNELMTPAGFLSNVLRNLGLHLGTPWDTVNYLLFRSIVALHYKIGIDLHDPRTTAHGYFAINQPDTYETGSGNSAHLYLILIVSLFAILKRKRLSACYWTYALVALTSFFVFCLIFKWQIWGGRYFLALFVLFAPLTVYVLEKIFPDWIMLFVSLGLLTFSWPWLFTINSRPLVSMDRYPVDSILVETRQHLYFANAPYLEEPYTVLSETIQNASCTQIGLMLSGAELEYPLWPLLGAPDDELRIEWIEKGTPSSIYALEDFQPCAVICQNCPPEWNTVRGLPRALDLDGFSLYLEVMPE
ncbi:MAG: hypothetical protein JXA97_03250 [Anaerolineales bacterium]|nr:hypothetical protein [Anaerolineales bacterium]